MPAHGEYVAGRGWYDASLRAWVNQPTKVTPVEQPRESRPTSLRDGLATLPEFRTRAEKSDDAALSAWRPNAQLEQLRTMRDSDKPEDRATAQRILAGSQRMALASYENGLRVMAARGIELPDDVRPT